MNSTEINKPEIVFVALSALIPYARNARTHSEAQVAEIAGSIREFGFTNPVLIDNDKGIIAGHGRVLAARKLSIEQVPCIRLDHLTDTQRRAYIIADNKIALSADWDYNLLAIELEEVEASELDLSVTGFSATEIDWIKNAAELVEDSAGEWQDMPEFEQENKQAFRRLIINFKSQEHIDRFAELLKQQITDKTKYLWFPKEENADMASHRY